MKSMFFTVLASIVIMSSDINATSNNMKLASAGNLLNSGWLFSSGDIPEASGRDYDDSSWRRLDLPHDWAFENGFSEDGAQSDKGGYACGGIGWYRHHLKLDIPGNKRIFLDFDAIYMNSEVWINGHYLGKRPYGYISFSYEITGYIIKGENIISIRVDNSLEPSARWYHGCGIYGNVHLRIENPLHFIKDGIFVTTPEVNRQKAAVSISYETSGNFARTEAYITYKGKKTGKKSVSLSESSPLTFSIDNPELWSPDTPELYGADILLYGKDGKIADREHIRFGIRRTEWTPEKGFLLNGIQTKLKGVCEHLEGGPVGAAWTEDLLRWKLQIIKDMGCNAIRTAHNPQLPVFYDICDEIGLMVMDEAFDGWKQKATHDYGAQAFGKWWKEDLKDMVRRDRNHPSVIIYSVGNETKGDVAEDLVRVCHENDDTRLVTSGHSGSELMDVFGVNGHSEKKKFLTSYNPGDKAFIGTETPHTWQVRGFYRSRTWYRDGYPNKGQDPFFIPDLTEQEIFGYDWTSPDNRRNAKQVYNSSYDNATVRLTARHNIEFMRDLDWYSGHFRWTGFDYLGEAGYVHGGWPFRAFQGGIIDLAGFPKDHYYLYRSQWREDIDMVHILPHWTHPDMTEGTLIPVWVYTTGDEAELFLNGNSLGRKEKGKKWNEMQCEWLIPWKPGTIKAVAYRNGKEICSAEHKTSAAPEDFNISAESNTRKGMTSIITFTQTDRQGVEYPYGDNRIFLSIKGNAYIVSFENGCPTDTECNFRAYSRRSFYGLSRAFVRSTGDNGYIEVLSGMISGDRSLKTSDMVHICLKEIWLKGLGTRTISTDGKYTVRYTTDGSEPDLSSQEYTGPFRIKAGMTVRATVYKGNRTVLKMHEDFGNGIYWGVPGEKHFSGINGIPVEYRLEQKPGDVTRFTWYQENDGGAMNIRLRIRYSQHSGNGTTEMAIYNNGKFIRNVKFTDTEPGTCRISETEINIASGANNLMLRSISEDVPDIKEIITVNQ